MKKNRKRLISILLSVMMAFSILTPAAFAAETKETELVQEEPVREYIYEVCPVTGFHVELNTTEAQLQEKLGEDYPTVPIKGSQNGQHDVPVVWNVEESSYDGSQDTIYVIKGDLDLTDYPYLINAGDLQAQIKVAVGDTVLHHITDVEVELSNQEVPYGTDLSELHLPASADVFLDGSEEPTEMEITWSAYFPHFVGEQRLVASLNLPSSMDCDRVWRWAVTVTVLPPEGIRSITAFRKDYTLPYVANKYADSSSLEALVVLEDGTEHEISVDWFNYSRENCDSVLCDPVSSYVPCDRVTGTINLSRIPGFENVMSATAIAESIEARDRTDRELISATYSDYVAKYSKGYLAEDVLPNGGHGIATVKVDLGGQVVTSYKGVIWDLENFEFDGNIAGEYTISGDVDLSDTDIKCSSTIRVTSKMKVIDTSLFLLSNPRRGYYVDFSKPSGTTKEEIVNCLTSEHAEVRLSSTCGYSGTTLPITWNTETLDYQGEDGVYFVEGTYDTTGRSVYLAGGSTVTARVNVGNALKTISRVEYSPLESQTVEYGTPLEELNLPTQATVYLTDSPEEPITVDFELLSEYIPTLIGTQSLLYKINFPEYVDVSRFYCLRTIDITVNPPEGIKSCSGNEARLVPIYSTQEAIEKLLQYDDYLDPVSTVVLSNGETYELPIDWNEVPYLSVASLDSEAASVELGSPCYRIRGEVDLSSLPGFEGIQNETVIFEFQEGWGRNNNQAFSVDPIEDLHVERGTTAAQVQAMLEEQYPELRVYLDLEQYPAERVCPITWDVANSNYNRFIEGSYTVFGDIDLTGSDAMMAYGEVKARAVVVVGDGGIPIVSVAQAEPVSYPGRIHIGNLKPELEKERPDVEVTLEDGSVVTLPVIWDIKEFAAYTGKDGVYTIQGILDLSENPEISNPSGLYAEMIGIRFEYNFVKEKIPLEDLKIGYGTSLEDVRKLVRERYPEAQVVLKNGETLTVPIIWDTDPYNYDPTKPAQYFFASGALDFSQTPYFGITNERIGVRLEILSDATYVLDVDFGSQELERDQMSAEQLQAWLEEEYPTYTVKLSDDSDSDCAIDWNVAASGYDGVTPGDYTIYGEFVPVDGDPVPNPNNCRAKYSVKVNPDDPRVPDIVASINQSIEVEQNIYLSPLSRDFELTGTPTTATPPKTVTVTLDDGNTAQLPVNWHVEDFDPYTVTAEGEAPQRIVGDIVIPEEQNIANPDGIQAQLDVTVTPMTYKVVQGGPKTISLEVYKGTSLEELNQQLEAEGKNEVSITATNSRNASKKTFSKIFLGESLSAEWNAQKDQCGTYTLTASWPENISMRVPARPVVINVAVTVREPLEIVSTKMANMDMYQGIDPENTENIPQKVTAILEDDSEVEIDVEWDWSFYNKNNLVNPPVLGHLKNLPKSAKQPENGEITASMTLLMIPVTYKIESQTGTAAITAKAGLTLEEITALSQQESSEIPAFTRTFHLSGAAEDYKTVTTDYTVPFTLADEENPDYSPASVGSHTLTASMALPDYIDTSEASGYNTVTLITEPVTISNIEPVSTIDREGTAFAELSNVPEKVLATLDVIGPDGIAKTACLSVNWNTESYDPFPEGITEDTPVTQTVTGTLTNVPAYIQVDSAAPLLSVTLGREFDILSITLVETGEKEVKLGTSFTEISAMVNHEAVLTLKCTNGTTTTQTVSFDLLEEDNLSYDPMTVGAYSLKGRLLVGSNVKNPNNLFPELAVRTAKYSLVEAYVPEEDIFMFVGEDPLDYLPETISALLSNDEIEDLVAVWDMDTIDAELSDFYVVEGTFDLPVYLENPDNIQPMVFVFVDEPDSQILSMTQLSDSGNGMRRAAAKQTKVIPGYTAHRYKVERLYEDGTVKEQIMTLYLKNQ